MNPPEVIVGVDGSSESDRALRWAAQEATRRGAELIVLYVYDWRIYGATSPIGAPFVTDVKQVAESIVANAVDQARSAAPDVSVRGEALLGSAGATLVAASCNGATIVVGNRGRGGFSSLLLGSVSQQVATHAAGQIVVVRGRAAAAGPIVVGVDDSDAADHALAAAFEEAATRGASIVAVRVYPSKNTASGPDIALDAENTDHRRAVEQIVLAGAVAPWSEKYPDVDVECVALDGRPAEVLIGLSASAQLVVVGSRGRGGFAGLLLGSVGQQLVHHSDCPVLIARKVVGSPF